jgi:hypothetical protein
VVVSYYRDTLHAPGYGCISDLATEQGRADDIKTSAEFAGIGRDIDSLQRLLRSFQRLESCWNAPVYEQSLEINKPLSQI